MESKNKLLNSVIYEKLFDKQFIEYSIGDKFLLLRLNFVKEFKKKKVYFCFHFFNFNTKRILHLNFKNGIELEIYKFLWITFKSFKNMQQYLK